MKLRPLARRSASSSLAQQSIPQKGETDQRQIRTLKIRRLQRLHSARARNTTCAPSLLRQMRNGTGGTSAVRLKTCGRSHLARSNTARRWSRGVLTLRAAPPLRPDIIFGKHTTSHEFFVSCLPGFSFIPPLLGGFPGETGRKVHVHRALTRLRTRKRAVMLRISTVASKTSAAAQA